ncbi:MFS transporter [Ostreiculturibacter nitratireducens]|uniref:MFS transporter n=1 Tax=Ostreiculturibacter nitratireducens TaxID=3075226 RepID=UPI0031B61789
MSRAAPLPAYALFGAMLASAGLPIYIHAPKVYAEDWGVSLAALGAVLFGLRLLDLVQDPGLGWVVARLGRWRGQAVAAGVVILGAAMVGLFAMAPPVAPLLWFAGMLVLLFSAYSFLTIAFYARGVARAASMGPGGHMRLAGWREGGALAGVSLAALAPAALAPLISAPYAGFAVAFAALCLVAGFAMRTDWKGQTEETEGPGFRAVLSEPLARRLLLLALVNAAPLAVTATLFLFFVESRLAAPGWEGPLLLLFFISAAVGAPLWARAAAEFGAKRTLLSAMALAIVGFGWAALLGPGDVVPFAVICVLSGAAVGADLVILPALFARAMARIGGGDGGAGRGFGLWSFASKFTLAFAAVLLLPALEASGFTAGGANPEGALMVLAALYALLPSALKLVAVALLLVTEIPED